jgi:hypothetical protein
MSNSHWRNRMAIGNNVCVLLDFGLSSPLFNLFPNFACAGSLPEYRRALYFSSDYDLNKCKHL